MPETLPEGTDHIVPGASATSRHDSDEQPANVRKGGAKAGNGAPDANTAKADAAKATDGEPRDQTPLSVADLRERAQAKAEELRSHANDTARDYAEQGKARASSALDDLARMIEDAAAQIDEKLGGQYGDQARRVAGFVSDTAGSLREREIEELLDDARALVRRSPKLAIGGAATAGFLLARILKSGSEVLEDAARGLNASGSKAA